MFLRVGLVGMPETLEARPWLGAAAEAVEGPVVGLALLPLAVPFMPASSLQVDVVEVEVDGAAAAGGPPKEEGSLVEEERL